MRQRLLALHVLAQLHRGERDGGVHVVGSRDDHRVERPRLVEQLAEVGVLLGVGILFRGLPQVGFRLIDVAQGDHLDAVRSGGRGQV